MSTRRLLGVFAHPDDEGLIAKFLGLVGPVLGDKRAKDLSERLWTIDAADDVAPLIQSLAK